MCGVVVTTANVVPAPREMKRLDCFVGSIIQLHDEDEKKVKEKPRGFIILHSFSRRAVPYYPSGLAVGEKELHNILSLLSSLSFKDPLITLGERETCSGQKGCLCLLCLKNGQWHQLRGEGGKEKWCVQREFAGQP